MIYRIKQGRKFPLVSHLIKNFCRWKNLEEICFRLKVTQSMVHYVGDEFGQDTKDWLKWTGIAFNWLRPMYNTVMIAYRTPKGGDHIEVGFYIHDKGGRQIPEDTGKSITVMKGQTVYFTITIDHANKTYTMKIEVEGRKLVDTFSFTHNKKSPRIINPHHGGDVPAQIDTYYDIIIYDVTRL